MSKAFRALLTAVAVLAAQSVLALKTGPVTYASGDEQITGFLAVPDSAGKHPAVIVIHDYLGLNEWSQGKAKKFAADGYVALAVDLYRGGVTGGDPDKAHQLMRGLPEDRAIRDLKATFAYLASRPDVDASRIGSVGWCMGGGYSLQAAIAEPKLAACVIYYGRLVTEPKTIEGIQAALLGNFGALDQGIPPDSVRAFESKARSLGKTVDFKIYEGAGHGFASSTDPKVFRSEATQDADARTDAFFGKYLKTK
jgi:carboxymethylenebutenolidase